MNRRLFLFCAAALAVAPAPAAAQRFEPTRFSVEVRGSGPDVILIPGLTAGREVWRATAASVPGYRYHLVQVAGFAGEPARGNRAGPVVAPLADELVRYIADRRLDRPAIVGHSMGGTLAMMVAARRPALAGRIMVVDMLPEPAGLLGGSAAGWAPLSRTLGSMIATPGGRALFGAFMGAFSPPNSGNRLSDPDVVGRATHELMQMDVTAELPRIRAPFTIVYASPDPRVRTAIDRQFAAAYAPARGARLVRIDASGHMVMLDQPARFRAELLRFLSAERGQ
ncbi:MAG TPA: alpha/beta hydrolase [Allosphingosinicella sp.]|nr:alpha/beta hydrolase [Allosphingosinicella sp.]